VVGQALAGGDFFTLRRNGEALSEIGTDLVARLKQEMQRLVQEDLAVEVRRVAVEEALDYFRARERDMLGLAGS